VLGYLPRPADQLNLIFNQICAEPPNFGTLRSVLETIAHHMNSGDLARAAIATGYLSLPVLSKAQCTSAQDIDALLKASPDDPKHPGWPAGAPEGQGGQFRPKDVTVGLTAADKAENMKRLAQRKTFRTVLVRALLSKRGLRLLGENLATVLTEEIPGVDALATAATLADDVSFMESVAADVRDSKAAMGFLEKGPADLQDPMVPAESPQGFASYDAFKKVDLEKQFGPAGDGLDYHHIVEQGPNEGVFPAPELQSTENIVKIPRLLHEDINSYYISKTEFDGVFLTSRQYLSGNSFSFQRSFGICAMQRRGLLK
jgi:hypothetical protein